MRPSGQSCAGPARSPCSRSRGLRRRSPCGRTTSQTARNPVQPSPAPTERRCFRSKSILGRTGLSRGDRNFLPKATSRVGQSRAVTSNCLTDSCHSKTWTTRSVSCCVSTAWTRGRRSLEPRRMSPCVPSSGVTLKSRAWRSLAPTRSSRRAQRLPPTTRSPIGRSSSARTRSREPRSPAPTMTTRRARSCVETPQHRDASSPIPRAMTLAAPCCRWIAKSRSATCCEAKATSPAWRSQTLTLSSPSGPSREATRRIPNG
mmetsp:Transcript_60323/g.158661  ORF Transcript_60323/g.158661 Transcript_60323/m.158661 type:complete len:260 (+) Transcript_60323:5648-6427(+)